MILIKCTKGHYTSHFELRRGEMFCPVCGSKTAEYKTTKISKPKGKPRALKKPWANPRELF
jgi:uncharacterized Zn finger protein (UPF0148 family)